MTGDAWFLRTKSFITGFRLICEGENVMIYASQVKVVNAFTKFGHPEFKE